MINTNTINVIYTNYSDFENIMSNLGFYKGWEFMFMNEQIPLANVFDRSSYGPALLALAQQELAARDIDCDLGLAWVGDANALFGTRVEFVNGVTNQTMMQIWRLLATAAVIESLPKHGAYIQLDDLQYTFGDTYALYVSAAHAMEIQ